MKLKQELAEISKKANDRLRIEKERERERQLLELIEKIKHDLYLSAEKGLHTLTLRHKILNPELVKYIMINFEDLMIDYQEIKCMNDGIKQELVFTW